MAKAENEYSYKARDNAGELVTGVIEAVSEQDVLLKLRGMQYTPVKIMLGGMYKAKVASAPKDPSVAPKAIKIQDMVLFCVNLSSMTGAGIPLIGAINVVADQLTNPYLGYVVHKVGKSVSEGSSFSESLEKFPKVFSKFFINMVRAGEISGTMNNVLKTMAVYMEQQENMRQKVRAALIYPIILMVAGAGVITLILTFVMPQFVMIFERSGVPLPLPTRILYGMGMGVRQFWWLILLGGSGVLFGIKKSLEIPVTRAVWDRIFIKMPLIGSLTCHVMVARFARTLGFLVNAGVPLLRALAIVKEVIDHSVFSNIVQEVANSAEKGEGLNRPLMKHAEFPKDVVYMISVGEESGQLAPMLNKAADFYENKVEFEIRGLLVYIEPIFISVLGAVVGVILASVLLPMFDMIKTIQH